MNSAALNSAGSTWGCSQPVCGGWVVVYVQAFVYCPCVHVCIWCSQPVCGNWLCMCKPLCIVHVCTCVFTVCVQVSFMYVQCSLQCMYTYMSVWRFSWKWTHHSFQLNLQGLKNLSLDPSLQNGPTKAIVSYLKSRYTRSVPYYHMKLMIIGAAAKGKTTLLTQLMSDRPIQPSKEKGVAVRLEKNMATLGVSVRQWSYPYRPSGHGSVVNYHINCWDFAGQEEFYSTHQCFLSQRSLYVVSACMNSSHRTFVMY